MKKILFALAAVLLLTPSCAAVAQQRVSSKTYYAGERITGVDASSAFDVVLVKSNKTRAVVEVNDMLRDYVKISRSSDGVVRIGMENMSRSVNREWNRMQNSKDRVMRLTLFLPSVNTIRLSGATDISTDDAFSGENVDIQLSGASEIEALTISSSRVKLQCSGASEATLELPSTRDLVVVASGASEVYLSARGVDYSKLGVSGASNVTIKGTGEKGDWSVSGASNLKGEEFATRNLSVIASGASSARVNASGTLKAETSGASSIRYAGKPELIGNKSNPVRPL
jgi:hypothetical protein